MSFLLQPWQLLFSILSGLVRHRQQQIIEYYRTQLETAMKSQGK